MEACEALVGRGIKVILVEMLDEVLTMLDLQLAKLVENHMKSKGADVRTAVVLEANGWTNVKVMEGGIMAWPYSREK